MRTATLALLLLGVLGGSLSLAQSYRCDWAVSGIGGGEMTSSAYRCGATAGQTASGLTSGPVYRAYTGFWQAGYQVGVAEEGPMSGAMRPALAAGPNPFSSRVAIRYSLASDGPVSLSVHDITGRVVRQLHASGAERGTYSVGWDGTDAQGRRLAGGVYFCRLVAGEHRLTEKLVLQR